jgi:hypothetical protein
VRFRSPSVVTAAAGRLGGLSTRSWALGSGALIFLGELIRVFVPTPVGLADNSDQARIVCGLHIPATAHDQLWLYLHLKFKADSSVRCADQYNSTEYPFVWAASKITRLVEPGVTLDTRILGVFQLALIAALCGLLVAAMRTGPGRLLAAVGLFLLVGDSVISDYALTVYSENAEILGLLAVCAGVLWWVRGSRTIVRVGALVLLTAGLVLMLGAKTQMLPVIPVVILLLFAVRPGRIGRRWSARACAAAVLLVVFAALAIAPPSSDARLKLMNRMDFVFVALLHTSSSPTADLKELGVPSRLVAWEGKDYWCIYSPARQPDITLVDHQLTYERIGSFLLEHPGQTLKVAQDAAKQTLSAWPTYQTCQSRELLGAYTSASGAAPGTPDTRLVVESDFLRLLSPLGLGGLLILWGAPAAALLALRRRRRTFAPLSALAWFGLGLSVVQFAVAAFGDGIDDSKHALLVPFGAMLAVLFTAIGWVESRRVPLAPAGGAEPDPAADSAPEQVFSR